ncbi:MAG: TatD family hydrolase [Phycisphaerales bacterium]|jgi:TatD DNase family protein|nr:TatD family hydrolase [Phycisphaerales bacterium]
MIDTHCHLTSIQFAERVPDVIEAAVASGVNRMITVATDGDDAIAARELANIDDRVFFSSGIHPLHADGEWKWDYVRAAAKDTRCVAWGELGLDRHYDKPDYDLQKTLLEEHLALIEGEEGDERPIIVHCRRAVGDLLPVFEASSIAGNRFVFHCFTETPEEAKLILDLGAMISFTGVVTYKNASEVVAAAELVPVERMMVETDAPYLSPEPVRKMRPNEPKNVVHTAEFLAKLKGVEQREFEQQLDSNAERFFSLPMP